MDDYGDDGHGDDRAAEVVRRARMSRSTTDPNVAVMPHIVDCGVTGKVEGRGDGEGEGGVGEERQDAVVKSVRRKSFLKNKLDVERRGREEEEKEARRIASYAGDAARTIENEQRAARRRIRNEVERCLNDVWLVVERWVRSGGGTIARANAHRGGGGALSGRPTSDAVDEDRAQQHCATAA
jgi:hypothetical protein